MTEPTDQTRILLIDDSPVFSAVMSEYLNRFFTCQSITDQVHLEKRIRDFNPDLILLDVYMPFMNGIDLLRLFKKNFPQTKIIILSSSDETRNKALQLGALKFLVKPIRAQKLKEEIDEVLKS